MARTINDFPAELLRLVLKQIKCEARKDGDSSFTSALATCQRWKDIGEELLWTDIALKDTQIAPFNMSSSSDKLITRTLSITISPPWYSPEEIFKDLPGWDWDPEVMAKKQQAIRSRIDEKTAEIWTNLGDLSSQISKMHRLESFSLRVRAIDDPHMIEGFSIRGREVRALFDSLPPSLRHLEFDDFCFGVEQDIGTPSEEDHVCLSLQAILPRLDCLRLRRGKVCEVMFPAIVDHEQPQSAADSNESCAKVFLLNTIGRMSPVQTTRHCEWTQTNEDTATALTLPKFQPGGNFLVPAVQNVLQNGLLANINHVRLIEECCNYERHEFETICDRSLTKQEQKIKYPLWWATTAESIAFLMRHGDVDGEPLTVVGRDHDGLVDFVEGQVWVTTTDGLRLPAAYMSENTRFADTRIQSLAITVGIADGLRVESHLLELEAQEGRTLLHAEIHDNLADDKPVQRDLTQRELRRKQARDRGEEVSESENESDMISEGRELNESWEYERDHSWDEDADDAFDYEDSDWEEDDGGNGDIEHHDLDAQESATELPEPSTNDSWNQVNPNHTSTALSFGTDPLADGRQLERDDEGLSDYEDDGDDYDDGEGNAADWL